MLAGIVLWREFVRGVVEAVWIVFDGVWRFGCLSVRLLYALFLLFRIWGVGYRGRKPR